MSLSSLMADADTASARRGSTRNGFYRFVAIVTTFAMLFGGLLLMPLPASAASAVATERLNLRSGPSIDASILTVIPKGAQISVDGDAETGYYPVTYNGTAGYAAVDWIQIGGAPGGDTGDTSGGDVSGGAPTGPAWVNSGPLNFRTGPSLSAGIITALAEGTTVTLTGQQSNGYWQAQAVGTTGWLASQFLTTGAAPGGSDPGTSNPGTGDPGTVGVGDASTGTATVTARLNLRRGPGTSYAVITVLPVGATVDLRGASQSGYYPLSYNGTTGWAAADWLTIGSSPAPTPSPTPPPTQTPTPAPGSGNVGIGDTATGSATTTARLNLRQGPGITYGVITVLPLGATVELRGDAQNGYYPLSYNGTTGWAAGDWLTVGSAPSPTPTPSPAPNPGDGSVPVGNAATGSASVTENLNLRRGPGTTYAVITVMQAGSTVELRGDPQNGFYPLSFNGTTGWAAGDWLNIGGSTPGPTPTPTPNPGDGSQPQYLYTEVSVNMRSGPGTNYAIVTTVAPKTRVTITGPLQNGWYPATWINQSGYMSADLLVPTLELTYPPDRQGIVDIIYAAADRYGQPREDMLRVAMCESSLNPNNVNASSGASGLFQFMPSTWRTTPYADQNIFDATANANAAAWMWSVGRRGEWSCQ